MAISVHDWWFINPFWGPGVWSRLPGHFWQYKALPEVEQTRKLRHFCRRIDWFIDHPSHQPTNLPSNTGQGAALNFNTLTRYHFLFPDFLRNDKVSKQNKIRNNKMSIYDLVSPTSMRKPYGWTKTPLPSSYVTENKSKEQI